MKFHRSEDFQYRAFAAYMAWTLLYTLRHIPTPLIHIHFIHWLSGTSSRYLGTIQDSRQQQTPSYVPRRPKKAVRRCVWQLMFTSNCIYWCLLVSDSVLWWLKMWRGRLKSSAGQLTSLKASLVRCFTFSKTSPKTSGGNVYFKTSLKHRIVKQKVLCFYTMF